ncbi:MAG: hypothetical protein CMQ05_00880 [Gammaproteobacteria bacterium]|nr:hypothetical protein [Gammaproteobacteria bacterium]RPG25641.1 MAG: DUF1343 domain-containing protein [Gammaproteobacteria bacterium TMED50]
MYTGIDNWLSQPPDKRQYGLVAHPASVTGHGDHTIDVLLQHGTHVARAFGPQHGMRGDKQDNMVESDDYLDPVTGLPVISLYGQHRRPTSEMLDGLDAILFDLQDIGTRIYTFITTLTYILEACSGTDTSVIVLDRPNPAGREIDGLRLIEGHESFVGCDTLPMRHGLTVGELARWYVAKHNLDVDLSVVPMTDYHFGAPDFGWPSPLPWINPSPNAASVNMARCFAGSVLLEGTRLSEGRGTTIPLEVIGAPDIDPTALTEVVTDQMPSWLDGCLLRRCYFEPTFHKHVGVLCHGLQLHAVQPHYNPGHFVPYRLIAGLLRALRTVAPDYDLWHNQAYEYEPDRLPIDVINGSDQLRRWVDGDDAWGLLEEWVEADLASWQEERIPHLMYSPQNR